jgi:hypothetical protein
VPVDSPLLFGLRKGEGKGRDAVLVAVVVVMTAARRMAMARSMAGPSVVRGGSCRVGSREGGEEGEEGEGAGQRFVCRRSESLRLPQLSWGGRRGLAAGRRVVLREGGGGGGEEVIFV